MDPSERGGVPTFRLLPFETRNGFENMAVDEAVFRARAANLVPSTLRFYKWDPPTASIGKHQSVTAEVDLERAGRLGVDVVRRVSGGGAVFHARGDEITYCIVVKQSELKRVPHERTAAGVAHALARGLALGLAKHGARPDPGVVHCPALFLDGKKISGNAQARRGNTILQHGTLLLDVDAELMYSVLKAPTGVPRSRMVRSVRAKVTGVRSRLSALDEEALVASLAEGFSEALGVRFEPGQLTAQEEEMVGELAENKYKSREWLFKYE
ncbi:MAG: lipoate--protein ligase family protein [Promethearchaeota archaeon]